jgi:hypothetical protein
MKAKDKKLELEVDAYSWRLLGFPIATYFHLSIMNVFEVLWLCLEVASLVLKTFMHYFFPMCFE